MKHVTVQNNSKLNQIQEKIMQSRDSEFEMYEPAASVTQYTILQQMFFIKNRVHSKITVESQYNKYISNIVAYYHYQG